MEMSPLTSVGAPVEDVDFREGMAFAFVWAGEPC
jgi:hypothetical protein